jgi:hypothetical protein
MAYLVPLKDWTGNISTAAMLEEATPPAKVDFLILANWFPIVVGTSYCEPALCYEGNDTNAGGFDMSVRHFGMMAQPGAVTGRAWITRSGDATGGVNQSATLIENTTSVTPNGVGDGTAAAGDIITTPSQAHGVEQYLDFGANPSSVHIVKSGDINTPTPSATTQDRMLRIKEALDSNVEEFSVELSCGFGMQIVIRTGDLSTL